MNGSAALRQAKKYTEDSLNGVGALKGAPCTIKSTQAVTGGTQIVFEWTDNSGNMIHAIKNGLYKTPDTSKKTIILNTLTNEILEFKGRKECEEYYGAEFRSICGSRQCKRFKHLREVM